MEKTQSCDNEYADKSIRRLIFFVLKIREVLLHEIHQGSYPFSVVVLEMSESAVDAIIDESNDNAIEQKNKHSTRCSLGMRHCFLDERAADALAAAILRSREAFNLELFIDTTMNVAFDESIISTLKGGDINEDLRHMAQTHFDAAEALRIARERAQEAVTAASARSRAESVFDGALGDDFDYSDGGFDSFPEAGDESYGYGGDYDAYDDLY